MPDCLQQLSIRQTLFGGASWPGFMLQGPSLGHVKEERPAHKAYGSGSADL